MKKLFVVATALFTLSLSAHADTYVQGYTKSDGTYVQGHYRSSPNGTTSDNFSTYGNINPYTGKKGTKPDYKPSYGTTCYGTGSTRTCY